MIYTMENTKKRGIRVQLFDADGQEQHMVIKCDTETGRLFRWKPGPDGKRYREEDGQPAQETVFVPAPLRAVVTRRFGAPVYKWWKPRTWRQRSLAR